MSISVQLLTKALDYASQFAHKKNTSDLFDVTMGSYNGAEMSPTCCHGVSEILSQITIEADSKTINFIEVTLDLTSGSYKTFIKTSKKIIYVHRKSNHPHALLKNIPENINKRLTSI